MFSIVIVSIIALMSFYALFKLYNLSRNVSMFKVRDYYSHNKMLEKLPGVSICIPARNEYEAMNECLELVLATKYPKFEVIVMDDESVDNTPQLVRAFAHDGVRFIEGGDIPSGWLGKNHALEVLTKEANGTYILFMDVDTKLSPDTLGQLVSYMVNENLDMMSALPQRRDRFQASIILAPLRYFWNIFMHTKNSPIATSSAWMIDRKKFIKKIDSFNKIKSVVGPETVLAKMFSRQGRYKFLVSDDLLGLKYEKKFSSQIETAIRLRYPSLRFSIVRTILAFFITMLYAIIPAISLIYGIVSRDINIAILGVLLYIIEVLIYYVYLKIAWPGRRLVGALFICVVLAQDSYISIVSMIKYIRGTVTWKGRSISPELSDIDIIS